MHRLKQVTISNFRSIISGDFPLTEYTALIGYNNAGKTNILLGCNWLLTKTTLLETDFHDKNQPVEVEGVISGITDEMLDLLEQGHRQSIRPYVHDDTLTIKRRQTAPGDSRSNKIYVKRPVPVAGQDDWTENPAGIENAIKAIFPEPILIGAIEDIQEDVTKNKNTTTIGRLISEIITPIEQRYGGKAQQAMDTLKKVLDADGAKRAPELQEFDRKTNQKLKVLFPGVSIRLHVPTPELKDFFKSGTIKVYEEGRAGGKDIDSFGSGAQRSVQMALIRQLAEEKRNANAPLTCTLLLIDEPELYLHPQAIEQVRVALKQLAREGYQVVFATHSAQMVKSEDANNALLIRKNTTNGTHRRLTLQNAINAIVVGGDHASQMEMLFALNHSHQILFSEKVLLTEGDTEQSVLPKIFEVITGGETLGTIKCALVKQGGVDNTKKSMAILGAMDIPTKAIVDLDFAFRQAIQSGILLDNDPDILFCKGVFQSMRAKGKVDLDGNGLPTKKGIWKTQEAYKRMAISRGAKTCIKNLHEKLLAQNIWLWKKGVIEEHLGITGKTPAHWSMFVNRLDTHGYKTAIVDHKEVKRLIAWIMS